MLPQWLLQVFPPTREVFLLLSRFCSWICPGSFSYYLFSFTCSWQRALIPLGISDGSIFVRLMRPGWAPVTRRTNLWWKGWNFQPAGIQEGKGRCKLTPMTWSMILSTMPTYEPLKKVHGHQGFLIGEHTDVLVGWCVLTPKGESSEALYPSERA